MNKQLKNIGVLVTRPLHQAENLSKEIMELGGRAILFPTLEIGVVKDQAKLRTNIEQLANQSVVVFVSPNAATQAMPFIQEKWPVWPRQVKIAAVGPGTARCLEPYHLKADYCPKDVYNSESVLRLPAFQEVCGKKIMVVCGEGGRQLLTKTLRQRGAEVTEVIAYYRRLPKIPAVALFTLAEIDIIVCTSSTGLQNLVTMWKKMDRSWLQNMSLLVISKRMIPVAKALGFTKTPVLAENATDPAIVRALITWQEKGNGECAI